jgi:5-methylcytosine-specific restriction protein A
MSVGALVLTCAECGRLAAEVHHRVPLEAGGAPYALDNLVSLCKPCHSRETLREGLRSP